MYGENERAAGLERFKIACRADQKFTAESAEQRISSFSSASSVSSAVKLPSTDVETALVVRRAYLVSGMKQEFHR